MEGGRRLVFKLRVVTRGALIDAARSTLERVTSFRASRLEAGSSAKRIVITSAPACGKEPRWFGTASHGTGFRGSTM